MQKFLSLLFSRRALAVVGVLVLALLVWFVGPLVSFDTLRPQASVGSRVVTIALLLMLLVLWLVNWSMSIIGISVLCLAIGFVTPLLALGDVHPFAPLWVRLTLIGFILLMYALYGLYRLWRALRMDEQLLRRFLHPRGEEVPVAGEIKADLRTVNHIVTQAIRQLRQLRVDMPGWRKIFEGKRFLYELPWFMVVGSPGDGKTTALLNTGLQFPLAEQMEQTSRILTVPGGGTLHCDWWFTNEAVLIDTAGRYARHDDGGEASAAQRNAGEWQGFLGLLRKHRPGAPLNGVILTLNVADLTAQSPAERLAACAALRARLAELRETLGIRFPVYLVVTKMDLLPGFSEYFRTLTSHLRAQIWGFTLPYSRRRKAGDPQALHAACAQELARLTLRLDQGLDTRLQEEYDLKSRQRLYTFPREFAALGEPLLEAIEQIFLDSKFDATQLNNTLRGVFFTSAAQAQADAVADQLSIWQRFVRAIKTARGESSASLPHALPDGNRSYFLHDLLTQFIFREAHLVEPNLQWAWRYRLLRLGGHLLVLVLAFLLWQGMQTSQQTNGDYLNEISARATRLASSSGHHLLLHRTQTPAGERLSRIELVQGGTRGNLVEYRYDDNGQLTGVVNRAGTQVRQFAYENGLMTAHSNAAGFTCRYRWQELDGAPRVTEHDTSDGEHYRFDYDFAAGTTTVTGRQGESWQWWYDRETYITAHRTPGGGMYRFTYNEDHFPVNIELPGGRTVAYEYDIQNRVVKTTDPEGRVTQTQWNGEFDEITRTALDDDAVWKTQYNAHGQPVQETDPEGRVTQYAYDEQGQMCSRTDAAGGTVVTAFDSRGQMTRYTDCSGRSTGYDHDEDGNLTRVTDAEGKVVRISYNRLGLPETVNSPGKQQDRYTWNALGLMSSHRRITGSVESWRYTPRGLLAAHTDEEKRETRWQYTPEGRVTALTNGNGAQYRFSHDADGRLVREVRPDGLSRTFILGDSGYLTAIQTTGTQGGVRRETQQRDALGRLLRTENEHGQRTFSYNRLDQITAVTLTPTEAGQQQHRMQADTVRFEYDRSGWLTAEHAGNGSICYQRDALGNPTDITLPDGQHLTHLYYGSGHLLQTALDGLTVSEYERDSLHRQIMRTQGQLATYSGYDDDGLLSWQRSLASGSAPVLPGQRPARQGCVTSRDYYWNNHGEVGTIDDGLRGSVVYSYDRSGCREVYIGRSNLAEGWNKLICVCTESSIVDRSVRS